MKLSHLQSLGIRIFGVALIITAPGVFSTAQSGMMHSQPGAMPSQSGTMSAQSGTMSGQAAPQAAELTLGPVTRELEGGLVVQFEIQPRPIAAMKDLVFTVTLSRAGKPVVGAEVTVDLTMPAMFMGKNSPALAYRGGGIYEGKGVLPRCMSGDKRWQAELVVREGGVTRTVAFPFETS
jgi:hypothetical protein